ncbi:unnamed protein product [Rotaria sp. Silwood1]|nr:unnamed protein product [Rotaria sp. Silwood1]CAF3577009.1 unnamed protein product [Rotaria sp. Silwood1]CAF3660996.1 unnamed protein product [Rotaria sp. Silwood1]CAF3694593.1 unnamed protein product [Rotaria sp. Silwood1]CAF4609504.1 unnamed protein product [Rotaria sp. Silwood1]
MTCHPQQSHFITVREFGNSTLYPGKQTVESITNVLADDFAQRILDSCRDVLYPDGDQHSLDTMCGRPYDRCTKESLFNYLGLDNPLQPFPIYFNLTNNTCQNNYYNQSTFQCNEPVHTQYENQPMCDHSDCPKAPPKPSPSDVPGKYSNISIRTTELIIVPDNQTFQTHYYLSPPGPLSEIVVGPALDLNFLTQVLDLQTNILNLEGYLPPDNISVRLTDICLKPSNTNCAVFSVLQYFQNSRDNLNKSIGDNFFLYADYITHIFQCSKKKPSLNDALLNISCFSDFGGIIHPTVAFSNYPNTKHTIEAKGLVITIIIENSNKPEKIQKGKLLFNLSEFDVHLNDLAEAWEKAFINYMQNFTAIQDSLRAENRLNELANYTVYYSNEQSIKNELNTMLWSNNQSNIK